MNTKVWQDASVPSPEEATGDAILGETQAISSETGELKLRKTQTKVPSLIQMHCLQRSLFMLFLSGLGQLTMRGSVDARTGLK